MRLPLVKQLKRAGTYEEIKIKCCYCDIREECPRRARKESFEQDGWVTRCPFTPNRPGKKKKSR